MAKANWVKGREFPGLDHLTLDQIQERVVRQRLEIYQGNKTKAAQSLGIDRETLRRYMKKYGIKLEA
ncbi:MAG: helix-turn-helix domain-containing protein [candidate division WOR-3 bacterium]